MVARRGRVGEERGRAVSASLGQDGLGELEHEVRARFAGLVGDGRVGALRLEPVLASRRGGGGCSCRRSRGALVDVGSAGDVRVWRLAASYAVVLAWVPKNC